MWVLPDTDWGRKAGCRGSDPDQWFNLSPYGRKAELQMICGNCPVIGNCHAWITALEAGLPANKRFGFWAGMTALERYRRELALARTLEATEGAPDDESGQVAC